MNAACTDSMSATTIFYRPLPRPTQTFTQSEDHSLQDLYFCYHLTFLFFTTVNQPHTCT